MMAEPLRARGVPQTMRRQLAGGYMARCERRGHWWDVKIYDVQRRRVVHYWVGGQPTTDDLELHVRISQEQERLAAQRQEGE